MYEATYTKNEGCQNGWGDASDPGAGSWEVLNEDFLPGGAT